MHSVYSVSDLVIYTAVLLDLLKINDLARSVTYWTKHTPKFIGAASFIPSTLQKE